MAIKVKDDDKRACQVCTILNPTSAFGSGTCTMCGSFLKTEAYVSSRRRRGEQESYQPVDQERIRDSVKNLKRKIEQLPIHPKNKNSERGEKKCLLDDLPALTEIPLQTIDSGLEDTFSESPLDKENPLVSCESGKISSTMEEITEKLMVLKFDKQVEDVVSKLYEEITEYRGYHSKKRMAKVVTDEVAVALIENRLYNTGLINGLKGLNIPVEIEKDVKKVEQYPILIEIFKKTAAERAAHSGRIQRKETYGFKREERLLEKLDRETHHVQCSFGDSWVNKKSYIPKPVNKRRADFFR